MRLLSHNPAMLRAMEYLALCVLPIPVLMFYSSITKNPKNKAVIAAVIAAVLNTLTTLIGLLVYAVILAIYEYKHIIEMQVRSSEAELMQALAMADTLTGLGSRAAFVAAEKELRKRTSGQVFFVHFDVNFLKKVNDEYGHAEGDRHLKATAKVLSDSFAEFGKVYRVGGDEFFAILDGGDLAEHYQQGISKLEQAQTEYNKTQSPPVPLQIAHGMAEYDCSQRDPEIAERLADSRMYEYKRSMKQPANA